MTPKYSPILWWPQKIPTKSSYPKKYSFFWKPSKYWNSKFWTPKMTRAYVCMRILEYLPWDLTSRAGPKIISKHTSDTVSYKNSIFCKWKDSARHRCRYTSAWLCMSLLYRSNRVPKLSYLNMIAFRLWNDLTNYTNKVWPDWSVHGREGSPTRLVT